MLLLSGLVSFAIAEKPKELRVYVIPTEKPEIVLKAHEPLAAYLEKKLGVKVTLTVPPTYPEVTEAVVKGTADLSYLGGLTYIQAKQQAPTIVPIVTSTAVHTTVMIARPASGIKSIKTDLRGKTFAFGSESSTAGHLIPRGHLLSDAHVNPEKDFAKFIFAGGHDKVAMAVASGEVNAGALYKPVYEKLVKEGKVAKGQVEVFWESPPFPDFPWVASGGLDPGFRDAIKAAFLALQDPKVLEPLKTAGYRELKDEEFALIRSYANMLGFLK
jgi:phosphonate transport system substrate-binding protein